MFAVRFRCILLLLVTCAGVRFAAAQQNSFTAENAAIAEEFKGRVEAYAAMRAKIESEMPQLAAAASAEEIDLHKTALLKGVQKARSGVGQGNLVTAPAARLIRSAIKTKFSAAERAELRKKIYEPAAKGVLVKANVKYPEAKELPEMPLELLLALPELPEQVKYRFVGRQLLLVDRDSNLILDYITAAL